MALGNPLDLLELLLLALGLGDDDDDDDPAAFDDEGYVADVTGSATPEAVSEAVEMGRGVGYKATTIFAGTETEGNDKGKLK